MLPENRGRTGRFLPGGPSPNPGGRPKSAGLAELVRGQTDQGGELVVFMLATLRNPRRPLAARTQAASWLADRGFGKPTVAVDATLTADVDVATSGCAACAAQERAREAIRANLTDEDLDRVARALLAPE